MSIDWEETFRSWSKPSSDTEADKALRAESMIKAAIQDSTKLAAKNISIFAQGSYKNNTNVKEESDVDICVCCNDIVMPDYSFAPLLNNQSVGLLPYTYTYEHFKACVAEALYLKFGKHGFSEGDKAFDVHENTYRLDADVVPAVRSRLYLPNGDYYQGTYIISNKGVGINNWPEQNYTNGVAKNLATRKKFKFITRAIKRLRNQMLNAGILSAEPIPSYLIECLVYRVPDTFFTHDSYKIMVEDCLNHLLYKIGFNECADWAEVNDIKLLFHPAQRWNTRQVTAFLADAYNYIQRN